jgi:hypothetical protein
MRDVLITFGIVALFLGLIWGSYKLFNYTIQPTGLRIVSKDGESCLVDHQCKVIAEVGKEYDEPEEFYRCLISDDYYNVVTNGDRVDFDIKNKCEKINP